MRPWQFVSSSALHPRGSLARALAPAFAWACLGVALSVAPSHAQFFNAVYSRDALDVVAVADSGSLYRSVSGGVAWSRTQLGDKALRDVAAWGWNIVVVGDSGKVWRSADLGGAWAVGGGKGAPSLRGVGEGVERGGRGGERGVGGGGQRGGVSERGRGHELDATEPARGRAAGREGGVGGVSGHGVHHGGRGLHPAERGRGEQLELPAARAAGADLGPVLRGAEGVGGEPSVAGCDADDR